MRASLRLMLTWCVQVPGDAEAALHRLQTKLLDVPAGAKRASREVSHTEFADLFKCNPDCRPVISVLRAVAGFLALVQRGCLYDVHMTYAPHLRIMAAQVQGAIESLKLVTSHLAAWSLPKYVHVTVEPYLRPHADYFTGVAFQVCVMFTPAPPSEWARREMPAVRPLW